jgi:hypothetical protein
MPVDESPEVISEIEAVANIKNFTTIPNSVAEFCIYTYKAEHETYTQVMRPGFFNSAFSFLNVGDTIRVFRFDVDKKLTHLLEFIVMDVDKIGKTVTVATLTNNNLEKKVLA